MATAFHTNVSLNGYHFEDSIFTFAIEGNVTTADVGKAVSLTGNTNAVGLAANNAAVIGRIASVEARDTGNVAAIELRFCGTLPLAAAANVVVGDTVVGGGAGLVKKAAANAPSQNYAVELIGNTHVVVVKV